MAVPLPAPEVMAVAVLRPRDMDAAPLPVRSAVVQVTLLSNVGIVWMSLTRRNNPMLRWLLLPLTRSTPTDTPTRGLPIT